MNKAHITSVLFFILTSCTNAPELETGEIKTFQMLRDAFYEANNPKVFIDARHLISRKKIDSVNMPVLFVELESGQNGTLTPYPGNGIGQTWLGADGATVTTENGILKATRGMGSDLMGSISKMPPWAEINNGSSSYKRKLSYLDGNNDISTLVMKCKIKKNSKTEKEKIKIWEVNFSVSQFVEDCSNDSITFTNTYYLDSKKVVRKSLQYHSEAIGYLLIERLDR